MFNFREEQIQKGLDWLDIVYNDWLFYFEPSSLRSPADRIVDLMERSCENEDFDGVWKYVNRLRKIQNDESSEHFQKAEILIRCGYATSKVHSFLDSLELLKSASPLYTGYKHQHGCALWMLGTVQWLLPNKREEAIINWGRAKDKFKEITGRSAAEDAWYENIVNIMERAICDAVDDDQIPSPWTYMTAVPAPVGFIPDHQLRLLPVLSTIPAGKFSHIDAFTNQTVQDEINLLSFLDIEQVLIDDIPHKIIILNGGKKLLNLLNLRNHYVLKVTGHSMNQAGEFGIQDGDYVLIREQSNANNGDIVAAEINDEMEPGSQSATLKRYYRIGENITLKPETSFPDRYKEMEFRPSDRGLLFHISGVAVALFRKAEP